MVFRFLNGEQNWLALWDLPNEEIERRVLRSREEKLQNARYSKFAPQSGKGERREARDEKRRVYKDIKLVWEVIRVRKEMTMLKAVENEKSKKIAVEVNEAGRRTPLSLCETLEFTIANTPGTEYIKPRTLGMRGREVDANAIPAGKVQSNVEERRGKRVDLGEVAKTVNETYVPVDDVRDSVNNQPFNKFDVSESQDHEALNLNHKLRRKLRRALDNAQIQKELLVRQRVVDHLKAKGIVLPNELLTDDKATNFKGTRILENGATETTKQEQARA